MHIVRLITLAALVGGAAGCATTAGGGEAETKDHDPVAVLEAWEAKANAPIETLPKREAPTVVLAGATVMTAAGDVFAPGYVVMKGGRISAVAGGDPAPVEGAKVLDLKGHFVTPGIIDTHSHLGVYPSPSARAHSDGNEATDPNTAGVWAEHAFWPQDPGIETAVAGGITTLQALPGSANLIGGRGVTLHMTPARGSRAMRFPGAPIGVKMACGENPKRVYGQYRKREPSTRMGNVRDQRAAFAAAREYLEELKKKGEEAKRNLQLETLAGLMTGKFLAHVHCYRADDILAFLQMADEFGFQVRSFHHGLEAYKVRDILADKHVSVSTWADWWGYKLEMYDGIPYSAALIHEAGARAVIHSDSARGIQRLNQEAAKAYRYGQEAGVELSDDDVLKWITLNPAWTLGIDGEVGSLEVGKRADVVVWDGHPFSVYTSARYVFVDGQLRYDKDRAGTPWSDFETGQGVTP